MSPLPDPVAVRPRAIAVVLAPFALAPLALGLGIWTAARTGRDLERTVAEGGASTVRALAGAALGAEQAAEALQTERADRLLAAARRLAALSGEGVALDGTVLDAAARESRARSALFVDARGRLLARSPLPGEVPGGPDDRIDAVESADAAAAARRLVESGDEDRIEGLEPNPFGTGTDLRAAARDPAGRVVVLRAKADELVDLREKYGLPALLGRAAGLDGVVRASLFDASGRVLADRSRPGASPGPVVRAEAALPGGRRLVLDLSGEAAERQREESRAAILAAAGVVAVLSAGAGWALLRAERLRQSRRQERALRDERERRLEALGDLGAGLAHQIRNPLNGVALAVQRLRRSGAASEIASVLAAETARIDALVGAFLRLTREAGPRLAPGDAAAVHREVAERLGGWAAERGVAIAVEARDGTVPAIFDPGLLREAVENLVRNAVEESPRNGRVLLGARRERGAAVLEVEDHGAGIPPGVRARMFEKFATTKPGGTGLGLAFALRLVEMQGGTLEAESVPGRTVFRLRLPAEAP
jgi:signal transduction histidine kinase